MAGYSASCDKNNYSPVEVKSTSAEWEKIEARQVISNPHTHRDANYDDIVTNVSSNNINSMMVPVVQDIVTFQETT